TRATKQRGCVRESEGDGAEAGVRKNGHREEEAVRQMASEFESLAEQGDGAMGREIPFRIPRWVGEVKDTMEKLREKAEERLDEMPEPVQRAISLGESILGLMLVPVRFGVRLARDALAVPAAMFRILTHREA